MLGTRILQRMAQSLHGSKIFACTTWNQSSLTFSGGCCFFLVGTVISLESIWHFSELIDDQPMSVCSSTSYVAFGMCVIFCISLFL